MTSHKKQPDYFIGVMSGTSLDGVDACLLDFTPHQPRVLGMSALPMPAELRARLRLLSTPQDQPRHDAIELLGECEQAHASLCIQAIRTLLQHTGVSAEQITACGVHGQTIRHRPEPGPHRFTLQLGNPSLIAEHTGIDVIADFRRRDLAAGGQGAPLVPPAQQALFPIDQDKRQLVLNLGGIANISILESGRHPLGFDTGPANVLLDQWIGLHLNQSFDDQGRWARGGVICAPLLEDWLQDNYFQKPPPKSTGTEYFNLDWLQASLNKHAAIKPQDVQATLLELTAQSVVAACRRWLDEQTSRLVICGGGAKNALLVERIACHLQAIQPTVAVVLSDELGVDALSVEAACFAWLARQWVQGLPGNAPEVTGAKGPRILGGFYPA